MTPTIIFDDENYLVIDKPSGLVVHPDGRTEETTLVDWILEKYPEIQGVGESLHIGRGKPFENPSGRFTSSVVERPGIVHRLDRETSGVMVVAKTQGVFEHLKKQFQEHNVKKEYRAFVYGKMPSGFGVIDRPIGKSAKDFRLRSAQYGARGLLREALTEYEVLKAGDVASYVAVFPKTGRTHQIRVHFKAIHHSLICDKLYAPNRECILGFGRLALHAHSLVFRDQGGEERSFASPLPKMFESALEELAGA